MKKFITLLLTIVMALTLSIAFIGCSQEAPVDPDTPPVVNPDGDGNGGGNGGNGGQDEPTNPDPELPDVPM